MSKIKIKFISLAVFCLILLFLSTNSIKAQTVLSAGDIAFTGYISTNTPDEFSFVLLKNVATGTTINFTDNSWLDTGTFRTGETSVTWTASSALSAGQEIKIAGLTATLASGAGSPGTVTGSVGGLNLSTSGDQILAFQGTTIAPTFISGIHMNVYWTGFGDPVDTTAAAWDSTNSNNTSASSLPPGLITATNAIWVGVFQTPASEFDNARFTCGSSDVSNVTIARNSINNQINWTKSNGTPAGFTLPTGCSYLVVSAASVSVTGRVLTASRKGISRAFVSLTGNDGQTRTVLTNSFGYYSFYQLQAGETYVLTVAGKRFRFAQASQIITTNENLAGIDFIAEP